MSDTSRNDEPLFGWIKLLQHQTPKSSNYAKKRLESYRRGIKAKGPIKGIMIEVIDQCCEQARKQFPSTYYNTDSVPHIPLDDCPFADKCRCVYRPLMNYQKSDIG